MKSFAEAQSVLLVDSILPPGPFDQTLHHFRVANSPNCFNDLMSSIVIFVLQCNIGEQITVSVEAEKKKPIFTF